jgi:hypothetical protein
MEDILAITLIFGGGTLFLLSVSPIGRAIADRIRARAAGVDDDRADRLEEVQVGMAEELDSVRQELAEVQERLDFTERLLARQRQLGELPRPEGGADAGPNVQS